MNDFNLCPICGGKNIRNVNNRKWICSDCGFDLYNNVAAAVGLVIQDESGRILLEKRAKEPRKGFLALPGGFVDPDETAEEACRRECIEEAGVEPHEIKYLCSFPNTYKYKEVTYKTCDLFFEAVLPKGAELVAQKGEVENFERVQIKSPQDVDNVPLAFASANKTLKLWLALHKYGEN